MKIVTKNEPVAVSELTEMAARMFGGLVKAVVDVRQETMAIDADMHADQEQELLEVGSRQADLWGINLYPELFATEDFIEFDSMINIRPVQENLSRSVEDEGRRAEIVRVVGELVKA